MRHSISIYSLYIITCLWAISLLFGERATRVIHLETSNNENPFFLLLCAYYWKVNSGRCRATDGRADGLYYARWLLLPSTTSISNHGPLAIDLLHGDGCGW
jgi:hypothetical protein